MCPKLMDAPSPNKPCMSLDKPVPKQTLYVTGQGCPVPKHTLYVTGQGCPVPKQTLFVTGQGYENCEINIL
ncbi:hypothetical protein DPMN_100961 [Dreissena polymorpha]|uniref:Uncharacterized protein n=1 Tax=Dreissena polymorpha TaxID=45954 RepID=A0A9D4LGT9_DREPO|nr:hypothetical protein DPMN_100961 [Dreissena polymorpha]